MIVRLNPNDDDIAGLNTAAGVDGNHPHGKRQNPSKADDILTEVCRSLVERQTRGCGMGRSPNRWSQSSSNTLCICGTVSQAVSGLTSKIKPWRMISCGLSEIGVERFGQRRLKPTRQMADWGAFVSRATWVGRGLRLFRCGV